MNPKKILSLITLFYFGFFSSAHTKEIFYQDQLLPQGLSFNSKGHIVKSVQGSLIEQGLTKDKVIRFRWEGRYVAEWDSKNSRLKVIFGTADSEVQWAKLLNFSSDWERKLKSATICEKYELSSKSGTFEKGYEGSFRQYDGCLSYNETICQELNQVFKSASDSAQKMPEFSDIFLLMDKMLLTSKIDIENLTQYYSQFARAFPFARTQKWEFNQHFLRSWAKASDFCHYLQEKTKTL